MSNRKAKETKVKAAPAKKSKRTKVAAEPVVTTPAPEAAPLVLAAVTTAAREERNGVKRPKDGGLCAAVWTDLDKLHASGTLPTSQQVRDLATARGWSENNALCELSAWRKWMGLSKAQPGKRGPRRKSAAKLAGLPHMSAEEVVPYTT